MTVDYLLAHAGQAGTVFAGLSVLMWLYLVFLRGGFWLGRERLPYAAAEMDSWPEVVAVIPARDEVHYVGKTVASLLGQDYRGPLSIVVVDDDSSDGTAAAARVAAGGDPRVSVISGRPLEKGWTGKLWAVQQGLVEARRMAPDAAYVLLTDADIEHDPTNLRRLVSWAEQGDRHLVSLMVRLQCISLWESLLIPAFVLFFQMIYPFGWVNDARRRTAAAAGGCMLVRRDSLEAAGGVEAIRGRVIDDCALAGLIKRQGPIWLGLSESTVSLRNYGELAEIWRMVARSAFEQLDRSYAALMGTVIGMLLLFVVPFGAIADGISRGDTLTAALGLAAWALMGVVGWPIMRLYELPLWYGLSLPIAGGLFTVMTVDSAVLDRRGEGAAWKGRHYGADG